MLKIFTKINTLFVMCLLASGFIISSCEKEEEVSSEVQLHSYGPSPALRGGELKFIGANLDKVTAVMLPDNIEIPQSEFQNVSPSSFSITVPEATMPGTVSLKTPQRTIMAQSLLGISEPIAVTSFSSAKVRPGEVVTLNGTYLNLVEEVIFADNRSVLATEFISHSKGSIQVTVPARAMTGVVKLSNGKEEPIIVKSEEELVVTLPEISGFSSTEVKAGTPLTITGSDLDLAESIVFGGDRKVNKDAFVVSEDGKQITVTVPENAQDGKVKIIAPSLLEVESAEELVMVVPAITGITPNPAKTSGFITVTGTNLDVISSVTFGGGEPAGDIQDGRSATEITVQVPATAKDSVVTFYTAAGKSVTSSETLTLVKPTVSGVSSVNLETAQDLTINGTHLDVIETVKFQGGTKASPASVTQDGSSMVVTVPRGSQSGTITLVTTNGEELTLTEDFTIVPGNAPSVTTVPESIAIGQMITIGGTDLDMATKIIFPGDITATQFGLKTNTILEVLVPEGTTPGMGKIKFVTAEGDISFSPEIEFQGAIKYYIYADALNSDWQQWNGWGLESQDWANTEPVAEGTHSIKIVAKADNWGAIQAHPAASFSTSGYQDLILSVYGTEAGKVAVQIKDDAGTEHGDFGIDVVPGQWTKVEIPLSELGSPETINELRIKNGQGPAQTFYVDEIGLR